MDYTKVPRELICRTRNSLEEFTTNNEMNECLVDNMLDIYYLHSSNFKERVTACFNAAYYICTLILVDEHPEWSLPKYYEIALCNQQNNKVGQAISLSLVRIYLFHFGSDWHDKHKKLIEKLDGFLSSHWIQQGVPHLDDYSYQDAFINLNSFSVATAPFTTSEFSLRVIDREAIEELKHSNFTWTHITNYYKYKIMQDIVFHVGKSEDEMNLLVDSIRQDAEDFYSKNSPSYESVYNRLGEIEEDVYRHFNYEENAAIFVAEMEDLKYQGDVRPLKARIAELEKEVLFLKQGQPQESIQSQPENQNSEIEAKSQLVIAPPKTIEEYENTIKDLEDTIRIYQMRGLHPAKRKGIALGLTPLQADIFGDYIAQKLNISFGNKKEELSLILNCLFGHGISSLANKIGKVNSSDSKEDRLYVASIFGSTSPTTAKEICSDWDENTPAPWGASDDNSD